MRFNSIAQLQEAQPQTPNFSERSPESFGQTSNLVLGGGSNILFTQNFDGLVLKNEITGIEKISEDENFVYIKCGAGENWHQVVLHCIENNWAGVENLIIDTGLCGSFTHAKYRRLWRRNKRCFS